mgnify:CR=1 FL=1
MNLSHEEEENSLSLSKFESMLKTNKVLFFDSEEFEDIILHYMDTGRMNLAKKALKLGLEQHPKSTGLKLVHVEMLVYEDKLDIAEKLLNELYAIEPTNEEIYIQKANIYSKKDDHNKAIEFLKIALEYTDDYADVYNLIGMEYLFMDNLELAKACNTQRSILTKYEKPRINPDFSGLIALLLDNSMTFNQKLNPIPDAPAFRLLWPCRFC